MRRTTARLGGPGLLLPLLVLSVACSGPPDTGVEGTPNGSPQGETVEVALREFEIEMQVQLQAGVKVFVVRNEGEAEHNFVIEGQGIREEFEENLAPGETRTLQMALKRGNFTVYCPVGNHRGEGMELSLQVLDTAPGAPDPGTTGAPGSP